MAYLQLLYICITTSDDHNKCHKPTTYKSYSLRQWYLKGTMHLWQKCQSLQLWTQTQRMLIADSPKDHTHCDSWKWTVCTSYHGGGLATEFVYVNTCLIAYWMNNQHRTKAVMFPDLNVWFLSLEKLET